MRVHITGRQVEVTPALRKFAESKLKKVEKLLDGPAEAHVVLAVEKHRHLAEIQVKSRHVLLAGAHETEDLYASIGDVVLKLERQALKHKEKLTSKKKREARRSAPEAAPVAPAAAPARKKRPAPRVARSERYRLKPLTAEDAVMELEANRSDLLVYRDAKTYRVNVVYRMKDGSFGLVDPEF
ncbi:MAG TPA: ribosome-associated translation inhibitor RaiA [Candidatus Polarisedimenticolaceae bacterium]|nr:ribosome-associated translation inhibitor RaiA [Candidatus Polarisedimenticolaceae bacterium]